MQLKKYCWIMCKKYNFACECVVASLAVKNINVFYNKSLYKESTCRWPKYLKNVSHLKQNPFKELFDLKNFYNGEHQEQKSKFHSSEAKICKLFAISVTNASFSKFHRCFLPFSVLL